MLHDWKFETDAGLTYNPALVEISGGTCKLLASWPADLLLYSTFDSVLTAGFSPGAGAASTQGTPAVDLAVQHVGAGSCQMAGAFPPTGVWYPEAGAYPMASGTMEGWVRASYNGVAAQHQVIYSCARGVGDNRNAITLYHNAAGNLWGRYWDANGVFVGSFDYGAWAWVLNQWYHFSYNFTDGLQRLFIDGAQHGPNGNQVGVRDNNVGVVSAGIGYDLGDGIQTTMWHDDFRCYGAVQRVAPFVPPAVELAATYPVTNPTVQTEAFPAAEFRRFAEHMENTDGEVRYHLMENGVHREYYDGTAWVLSDGSYAQSSTAEQMVSGMPGHDPVHDEVSVVILLHSDAGLTTPELGRLCIWTARFAVLMAIRAWLAGITAVAKSDEWFAEVLSLSDRWVSIKLSKYPDLLVELPDTPEFTQALAEAAGCEAALRRAYSDEGESAENSDRKMWEGIRDELLKELLDGDLGVGPGSMLMTSNAQRANFYPRFGYGEWSERILSRTEPPSEAGYHEIRDDAP